MKVARIRYGLKIKRYATVFYFTELTPDMQVEFDRIKRIIEESYCSFGFTPIDTPVLERSEILLAKAGDETEKRIYRFTVNISIPSISYRQGLPWRASSKGSLLRVLPV